MRPLHITDPVKQVAVLNKWAAQIEQDIRDTRSGLATTTTTANGAATATSFSKITSGINLGQNLVVGNGSVLSATGTGIIDATEINGVPITGDASIAGEVPITDGTGSAVWGFLFKSGQATATFFNPLASEDTTTRLTISAPWVLNSSLIFTQVVGGSANHPDVDDVIVEGITSSANNIVPGVSFDIALAAPNGSWGDYLVNYFGV